MKKMLAVVLTCALSAALSAPVLAADRPENVTIAPRPNPVIAPAPFEDVSAEADYAEAVRYVQTEGLMNGTGSGCFTPDAPMTRAMLLTTLWRMAGQPTVNYLLTYEDVDSSAWYGEAVRWAASEQVIEAAADQKFNPEEALTREAAAAMIYSYARYQGKGFQGAWAMRLPYPDAADMAEDAYEPICWMAASHIFEYGEDVQLNPKGIVSRGQGAEMLQTLNENVSW